MQFPRAPRFVNRPPSEIPGPGSYDPHSPKGHDKKGLLNVVQAERFDTKENNNPSTFGMYVEKENQAPTAARKRVASSSQAVDGATRERHKQQLEELKARLNQAHEKEVSKLQAKLVKYESNREDLMKDKSESGKEVARLKSDIRHLSSKLTKTESLLEKHQASLPLLQSKMTSLQTSHEQSRQRKESELATLRSQLEQLEVSYQAKSSQCREYEEGWDLEREGARRSVEATERVIAQLKDEVRQARLADLATERFTRIKLERQLQDRLNQVESLVEYSQGLEETVRVMEEQVKSVVEDHLWISALWKIDRELLVVERSEKEWRQRARSDQREKDGLIEELDGARVESDAVAGVEKTGEVVWKMRKREWKQEKEQMTAAYETIEGELDSAVNEDIPRLERQVDSLTARLEEQTALAATLESDLSNLVQESAESTERFEGEIEEQKRIIDTKATELEKERVDKRRVVGLLVQSRAAESALREQVEELGQQLQALAPLTSEHNSLQQTVDHLARINAATEQDLHDLIGQNAELAGHSNQNQKIKHVASLREDLIESKRKHLSTISLLTAAQNKVKNLERELDSYRAVPVSSHAQAPPSGRSRVSRPNIDDVEPPTPLQLLQQQQQQQRQSQTGTQVRSTNRSGEVPTIVTSSAPPVASIPRASNRPPRTFRASVTPTTSTLSTLPEDEPLLPPILAKSAGSFLTAGPAPTRTGAGGSLVVRDARRRQSELSSPTAAERMEGRMSVSELFN